jgi:competence protein ComEA
MTKLLVALVLAVSLPFGCADDKPAASHKHELVDLNTASMSALEALPGIGEVTAKKIIAGRPYERKDQLVSRNIVTEAAYEKFKDAVIAKQN